MSLIIPANTLASGGFSVDNSLRFNSGSSDYLNRTPSSAGTQTKATISVWLKRSNLTSNQCFFSTGNNNVVFKFVSNDKLTIYDYNGSSMDLEFTTTQLFRDVSAWYNIVVSLDSTQATASDRAKLYVNGSLISDFDSTTYPSLNYNFKVNGTLEHFIGRLSGLSQYFNGYMAEFVNIDGQQLDPTSFGEFDEDSGIWKPISVSGLTFGTNGFYLDFEDSGALGADVSGESNNFTVNNLTATDQSTDTCTNNFATINGLDFDSNATLSDGNLSITTSTGGDTIYGYSNFGVMSGKYYIEAKQLLNTAVSIIGVDLMTNCANNVRTNTNIGNTGVTYRGDGQKRIVGTNSSFGSSYGQNDIVSIALDMDNYKVYFAKNGVYQGSGNPSNGTNGLDLSSISGYNADFIGIAFGDYNSSDSSSWQLNFGSPPFAISSGNTDGNGYGNFEYAPPSGYLSLCTANLSEVLG